MNTRRVRAVFLNPGELYFGDGRARVKTILGSCISVSMRSPESGLAAMCHCLLPHWRGPGEVPGLQEFYKYVDLCVPMMLDRFANQNTLASLEVKIFGGADMFRRGERTTLTAVGRDNAETALHILTTRGLDILTADVGGTAGRKIVFDTWSGEVYVRRLRPGQSLPQPG